MTSSDTDTTLGFAKPRLGPAQHSGERASAERRPSDRTPLASSPELPERVASERKGALCWIAAGIGMGLLKFKALIPLLKAAPLSKLLITGSSMAFMIAAEATRSGLPFAFGFVILILIHELGHGVAIRREGLQAGWPVFIPFFGAMISMRGIPKSQETEAKIAYAGPAAGTVASLAVAGIYLISHARIFLLLAYTGFFLNLFNMVPVSPLDGGRVARTFSRGAWIIGAILFGVMFFASPAPQLLVIAVLSIMHSIRRPSPDLNSVDPTTRRAWALRYFGLCLVLGAAIYFSRLLLGATAF